MGTAPTASAFQLRIARELEMLIAVAEQGSNIARSVGIGRVLTRHDSVQVETL